MKATDLMIGDWVLCNDKPYQIAEISAGLLCIDAERELFAAPEDIQPIPLTPEILEKNGCVNIDDLFSIDTGNEEFVDADIYERSESMWVLHTYDLEFGITNNRLHIAFVHELQNAIRLCGIEKEIVL